jgi:NAD(P)-dependent dehydrogenase (short-subunit alcohol dehydrogenase family)
MSRDKDLLGKVFAITGGASGIGLSTAKILIDRGASIAVGDIDSLALAHAAEILSPAERVQITKLDVRRRESVDAWVRGIVERFGKLSGAAYCAGVIGKHHGTRGVEELEDGQWDLIMGVNLTGEFLELFGGGEFR